MKIVQESVFLNAIRSFFAALFAMLGILVGLVIMIAIGAALFSSDNKEHYSSNTKLLPDDHGNRKYLGSDAPVILQISFDGEIGKADLDAEKIRTLLLESREEDFKNDRVKALLLIFNTPGGAVFDSDSIYRQILEYKKRFGIPVYAYVEGICASGGYYIACAADKIYATEVSIVGSIGVLAWPPFFNVSDVMKKIGVESMTLSAGLGKDEMNPLRPWKEGEQDNYQNLLNFYYAAFTKIVSNNRPKLTKEKLIADFGAKVFPAPEAKELGYVDEIDISRSQVLKELATLVGIQEKYQVISLQSESWWKKIIESNSALFTGKLVHEHRFFPENQAANPFAYIYKP